MPVAVCLIRDLPHYRLWAFISGLREVGFTVGREVPSKIDPADVLVVWNRYGTNESISHRFERAGAPIIVAENGWIGTDDNGHQHYALCLTHHNGPGTWHVGDADRWSRLHVELEPWRTDGRHIVVLPQRGIGPPGVAMPKDWLADVTARLAGVTKRPILVRPHPGKDPPERTLEDDFRGAWAAVTWGSGAAIKAIAAGIPVFHELQNWIGAPAARFGIDDLEHPFLGDRTPMLRRLAWAQWSVEEVSQGEPFRCLLPS